MAVEFKCLKYIVFFKLFFVSNELNSQQIAKDTLCKYVENLSDSSVVYIKDPKGIPKKVYRSVKRLESHRIKIEEQEKVNFSDVNVSDKTYGLVYFAKYANYYYLMLKQGGFVPSYVLKILIEEHKKIRIIKNFHMIYPYYLNEFVHLKWGCEFYTTE